MKKNFKSVTAIQANNLPLVEYPCEIKTYVHIKTHEQIVVKALSVITNSH